MTSKGILCPLSHKVCEMCALYRGRHYYAFPSCAEYLRHLNPGASKRSTTKVKRSSILESHFVRKVGKKRESITSEMSKPVKSPTLKVSQLWNPFEEICDIEQARYLPFQSGMIIVVDGQVISSYEELTQLVAQPRYKSRDFLEVRILPRFSSGG